MTEKLPDFETVGVIHNTDFKNQDLTYGIVFKTSKDRKQFIETALRGAKDKTNG